MVDQTTQHRGEKHYRNRLRECRLRSLISTQKELARKSGIDRTTISALENNRLFLSIHYALCLREVLGCSLDDLYERITDDAENRKAKRRNATRARA
ncbi:MAG TPA: helix-turn-helix transcriptional regulator [Dehalococcoidia bacterium]|nr:helix-turn-helix transcriptional regulator [Dehalococcoidia bacterium]